MHFVGTIAFHVRVDEYDPIPVGSLVVFNVTTFNQGNG